jgi:hypothetical protein
MKEKRSRVKADVIEHQRSIPARSTPLRWHDPRRLFYFLDRLLSRNWDPDDPQRPTGGMAEAAFERACVLSPYFDYQRFLAGMGEEDYRRSDKPDDREHDNEPNSRLMFRHLIPFPSRREGCLLEETMRSGSNFIF